MNKNTRAGFVRRIKRGFLALAMTTGLVGGMTVAMASPAAAANEYTVYYPAFIHKACQMQGHTTGGTLNPLDPYSGFCYDLSFPFGYTQGGSVDMQGYCDKAYPGSTAVATGGFFDWKCKRVENPWSS